MKQKIYLMLILSFTLLPMFAQEKATNIGEMFTKGVYDVKLRLAFEESELDNGAVNPGRGTVLSSYIGFKTAEYEGFSLYSQFHNLWKLDDRYNDGRGKFVGDYDPIADPDGNRLQQLYADFTMIPDTKIRVGRQEINLDDVRFIGNIGWRNTAQAFDAITLTNNSIKDTTIFLGYSENVASILFSENKYDHIFLSNVKYSGFKGHNQTLFSYWVDSDPSEFRYGPSIGHDAVTNGVRFDGKVDNFGYDFTYAHQQDWQDSDDLSLSYFNSLISYTIGDFTPAIGYSYIEGADAPGERSFSTLFGTAHIWDGWSDQFIGTNAGALPNGLQNYNASLTWKQWGATFKVAYHYFDTTEKHTYTDAYGQELNFIVSKPIAKNLVATAKLAYYDRFAHDGNPTADEVVFWLRFDYSFSAPIADPFNIK